MVLASSLLEFFTAANLVARALGDSSSSEEVGRSSPEARPLVFMNSSPLCSAPIAMNTADTGTTHDLPSQCIRRAGVARIAGTVEKQVQSRPYQTGIPNPEGRISVRRA